MINYYAFYYDGELKRIAKIEDNAIADGFDGANWVEMPNLLKIVNEDTDYQPITEAEANKLIKETY